MVICLFVNTVHATFQIPQKPIENSEKIHCAYEYLYWIW